MNGVEVSFRINDSADGRIIMDPAAIQRFVNSPSGPVMRDLVRRATLVQEAARHQVRLGHVGGGATGVVRRSPSKGPQRTNLRYSIVKRVIPGVGAVGPAVLVGSDNPIALIHHEGTRPHVIRPRNARVLTFWSDRGGQPRLVFAHQVNHPGTKPNRYLTDNLHLAAL